MTSNVLWKKSLAALLAVALGLLPLTSTQAQTYRVEAIPLMYDYDLDAPTEAADADQILTSVNLTNTTFTLDGADPDVPREVTVTVTDTSDSINAGTVTVTGTDINGDTITWVIDVSGHAGGAVVYNSIDTTEDGDPSYLFATVTSIVADSVATLGGLGDELIEAGTGNGAVAPIYCATEGSGGSYSDRTWKKGNSKVETSGSSTTVTSTGSLGSFGNVAAGDPIYFRQADGSRTYRYVSAKASANSITVNEAVTLEEDDGHSFWFRTLVCGYGDENGWVEVASADEVTVFSTVHQLSVTNHIDRLIECRSDGYLGYQHDLLQTASIDSFADADNAPFTLSESRGYSLGCKQIRVGWIIVATGSGTNLVHGYDAGAAADDGTDTGTAAEKITAFITTVSLN